MDSRRPQLKKQFTGSPRLNTRWLPAYRFHTHLSSSQRTKSGSVFSLVSVRLPHPRPYCPIGEDSNLLIAAKPHEADERIIPMQLNIYSPETVPNENNEGIPREHSHQAKVISAIQQPEQSFCLIFASPFDGKGFPGQESCVTISNLHLIHKLGPAFEWNLDKNDLGTQSTFTLWPWQFKGNLVFCSKCGISDSFTPSSSEEAIHRISGDERRWLYAYRIRNSSLSIMGSQAETCNSLPPPLDFVIPHLAVEFHSARTIDFGKISPSR
jgi:hypothetical protein